MTLPTEIYSAVNVPTQFVQSHGRTLAYRRIGQGHPIVLCLRLRGVMDAWDPAFLDALAKNFTVITFDYTGLGQSTGKATYDRESLSRDAYDLIDALGFDGVVIGGWSLGGIAAQIFAARYPERTTHAILIGTVPPGPQPFEAEPIFLPTALKPVYTIEDETVLFFEPLSPSSRVSAVKSHDRIAARKADRSPPISEEEYLRIIRSSHDPVAVFPDSSRYSETLANSSIPLLAICSDHDISFPVENWYALNRAWKTLSIFTFPQTGHGMQHEFPEASANLIANFVQTTTRN